MKKERLALIFRGSFVDTLTHSMRKGQRATLAIILFLALVTALSTSFKICLLTMLSAHRCLNS